MSGGYGGWFWFFIRRILVSFEQDGTVFEEEVVPDLKKEEIGGLR